MRQILENNQLRVEIDTHGAEIQSIKDVNTGHEYLWQGDSRFWGRRSPVLFPIVGSVWEGKYRMDGNVYELGQHGFARDLDFAVLEDKPDDEAWFGLEWTDETIKVYPRKFRLETGYKLTDDRLSVEWRVTNVDSREMWFQIGAHPAFNYPAFNPLDDVHGYLMFDRNPGDMHLLGDKGCYTSQYNEVQLDGDGMLPLTATTFDINTIVVERSRVRRVSLLDKSRRPYLSVIFNAPVVGIWSPRPEAPFVCIEPWWGRADDMGFEGDFSGKAESRRLEPGKTFTAGYMVVFESAGRRD